MEIFIDEPDLEHQMETERVGRNVIEVLKFMEEREKIMNEYKAKAWKVAHASTSAVEEAEDNLEEAYSTLRRIRDLPGSLALDELRILINERIRAASDTLALAEVWEKRAWDAVHGTKENN